MGYVIFIVCVIHIWAEFTNLRCEAFWVFDGWDGLGQRFTPLGFRALNRLGLDLVGYDNGSEWERKCYIPWLAVFHRWILVWSWRVRERS